MGFSLDRNSGKDMIHRLGKMGCPRVTVFDNAPLKLAKLAMTCNPYANRWVREVWRLNLLAVHQWLACSISLIV
ncbi:MAG: hypothetical protein HN505_08005 [Verrucomicrobia bacterium]|nr:hypothetical protein [Verrucomicrobiota bacterium]